MAEWVDGAIIMLAPARDRHQDQRGLDGHYRPGLVDDQGMDCSVVLQGLWPRAGWRWQHPLPPVPRVLKELGVL